MGLIIKTLVLIIAFLCGATGRSQTNSALGELQPPDRGKITEQNSKQSSVAFQPESQQAKQEDAAARRFVMTCSGCHSLSGVRLTGPELSHVATWPTDQLKQAISRMQDRVGPLTGEEIDALASLLHDPKVRERLKAEESRIQEQLMAKLEPANYAIGRDLFYGKRGLKNGGLACISCHKVNGVGGNLGPDLSLVINKMAEPALASAIEKSSFLIMGPHYKLHPIELQEALHIARYLAEEGARANVSITAGSFTNSGVIIGAAAYGLIVVYLMRAKRNRNKRI